MEEQVREGKNILRKMKISYAVAIAVIGMSMLASFGFLNHVADIQQYDAKRVNISGRQCLLGQRLTQLSMQLALAKDSTNFVRIQFALDSTYFIWKMSHQALENGSKELGIAPTGFSDSLALLFDTLAPYRQQMAMGATTAIGSAFGQHEKLHMAIGHLLQSEGKVLYWMDRITLTYIEEATYRVRYLSNIQQGSIVVWLLLLGMKSLFVFRPLMKQLKRHIFANIKLQWDLLRANRKIEEDAYEIKRVEEELSIAKKARLQKQADAPE